MFERSRAAWLVLPIPAALAASQIMQLLQLYTQTWLETILIFLASDVVLLLAVRRFVTRLILPADG